jgi:hypothetical protein
MKLKFKWQISLTLTFIASLEMLVASRPHLFVTFAFLVGSFSSNQDRNLAEDHVESCTSPTSPSCCCIWVVEFEFVSPKFL